MLGTVGVLSECVTATGAAVPLGWAVEALAGDSLFVALLATAVMCIVLVLQRGARRRDRALGSTVVADRS